MKCALSHNLVNTICPKAGSVISYPVHFFTLSHLQLFPAVMILHYMLHVTELPLTVQSWEGMLYLIQVSELFKVRAQLILQLL